ncbi:beta-lactamase superfamily domain-containing protein [Jimgerdemannia flammicorona]|uniref:Beta-lactamase superfamily domain-containing protein n=1 Tax=Jimgerdemannia flammicorona TaxID=994334 RepID=A0A433ATQ1_9FUNG|nr:beta-lactamase superfamily domain-containing protein [Jimgerdemannia flammicorona]
MQSKALTHRSLPIHIDNHLILPAFALFVTSSTLLYYYFSTEATRRAFEAARRRHLLQREKLASSEAKYASLRIHGQFANPFVEWRDTPWWETVLFWLGRIRGNSDLTSALPITKPSFDLLFPPAVSALDGPSRLPPSIRVFGTATPSLSESWVDAATVTASAPTSGIGIPPRIVFDPAPAPEQGPRMTYTWLGQSTSFVTMDGFNILTDPVFSPRVINSWFGPKRVRSLPCELKDLKRIDIVLVSHNHRDHLDEQVVRELNNTVTWYIPMGLRDWFVRRGVYNVIELDWWQEIHHKERQDIVIAAVPCMHWSGRCVPYDTNRSLWCSFVVKSQQHSFLHW